MSKQPPASKQVRTEWEVTIIITEKEDAGSNKRISLQIEDMAPYFERYPLIRGDTHGPEKNTIANWGKTVSQVLCLVGFVASVITIYVFFEG